MAGHVFLVRGDIRRLACDAWLMPSDAAGRAEGKWLLPDAAPPRPRHGKGRVFAVAEAAADTPRPWLVDMNGAADTPADWYVEGVRQFLAAVRPWLEGRGEGWLRRQKPLVAVPLVGTGGGGARDRAGQLMGALL